MGVPLKTTLLIIWMGFLVATGALVVYKYDRPAIHPPAFKAKQCFVRNEIREDWQGEVDGVIVTVGNAHYLLMIASEADRVSGGDKIGVQMEIQEFDRLHHPRLCPENWTRHRSKK